MDNVLGIALSADVTDANMSLESFIAKVRESGVTLQKLKDAYNKYSDELNRINKELKKAADVEEEVANKIDNIKKKIANLEAAGASVDGLGQNDAAYRRLLSSLEEYKNKLEELSHTTQELSAESEAYGIVLSDLDNAIKSYAEGSENSITALKETLKGLQQAYSSLSESERDSAIGQSLAEQIQQVTSAIEDASEEMGEHESALMTLFGGTKNYKSIVSLLPGSLKDAAGGVANFTKAAWKFIATPIGAIIGAIVLALQALSSWFTKSAEGQEVFARISGYCSGVLQVLNDVVVSVGDALYKAFTEPKKAVKSLWETIKKEFLKNLQLAGGVASSFGKVLKATFSLDWKGLKKATAELLGSSLQLSQSCNYVGKAMTDMFAKTHKTGKAMADISSEEHKLKKEMDAWVETKAKLEAEKQKVMSIIDDDSKSLTERQQAMARVQDIVKKTSNQEQDFANRKVNLQERKIANKTSVSDEDKAELSRLRADAIQKESEGQQELNGLQQRIDSMQQEGISYIKNLANLSELQRKQLLQAEREAIDRQHAITQAEIDAMEEGTAKKLRQIDLDEAKEKEAIQRRYEDLKQAKIDKARQLWEADPKNKKSGKIFDPTTVDVSYSEDETAQYNAQIKAVEVKASQQKKDIHEAELASMREYLKEYGTFEEKKLAITEEYEKKIKEARKNGFKGEVLKLEKEKNAKLVDIEQQALNANIDWKSVYGQFGGMMTTALKPIFEEAKEFQKTDEYKKADKDTQRGFGNFITQLEEATGEGMRTSFAKVGEYIEDWKKALQVQISAQQEYRQAQERATRAEEEYAEAKEALSKLEDNATEKERKVAEKRVDNAKQAAEATKKAEEQAAKNLESASDRAKEASDNVKESSEKLKESFDGITGGLSQMKGGSLEGIFNGFKTFSDAMGKQFGKVGEKFQKLSQTLGNIPIVGEILSIIDIFKDGIAKFFTDIIDTVISTAVNIITDILNFKDGFVRKVGDALINGIRDIFESIVTFGGLFGSLDSWFGLDGNSDKVAKITERLNNTNENLCRSVDALKNEISKTSGMKSVAAAKDALENQKKVNENQRKILDTQMHEWGKHHSNATYFASDMNAKDYAALNKSLEKYYQKEGTKPEDRKSVHSYNDFINLSPEEMAAIRTNDPELWEKILNIGYKDKKEYLNAYADRAGELEEITEDLRQALTQTSFDSLKSSFTSSLMDMSKDARAFSEDFTEMMQQSILASRISDLLDDEIEDFYKEWAKKAEDGELSEEDIEELQARWDAIVEAGVKLRDDAAKITGYSGNKSQQSGTSKTFEGATQDQMNEANGRMTAIQANIEQMYANSSQMLDYCIQDFNTNVLIQADTAALRTSVDNINGMFSEMLDIQYDGLNRLDKIIVNTNPIPEMKDILLSMDRKLNRL